MNEKTIDERLARSFSRNPGWDDKRRAKSLCVSVFVIRAYREQRQGVAAISSPAFQSGTISISSLREKFDVPAAIKRELAKIGRGSVISEEDLCRLTVGKDRSRFRRALDNNPELVKAHRLKMRLDDSPDGKFYWGGSAEIAEARKLYEG